MRCRVFTSIPLFAAAGVGQDQALASGPPAGAALGKVEVFAPVGPRSGETYDAAETLRSGVGMLLFVHELSRNTAPMVRGVDALATEFAVHGVNATIVFLAADRTEGEAQIRRSSPGLNLGSPMVISTEGAEGPGSYALNRRCTLTLVVGEAGRVHRSLAFTDTGPQDVPEVRRVLVDLVGEVPSDTEELRELLHKRFPGDSAEVRELVVRLLTKVRDLERVRGRPGPRMRGDPRPGPPPGDAGDPPPPRPREGKPPTDEELRTLLRAVIQRTATAATLDEVFRSIDARVGNDPDLRSQAVEMFKLILSLDYGTEGARERARRYVAEHGSKR